MVVGICNLVMVVDEFFFFFFLLQILVLFGLVMWLCLCYVFVVVMFYVDKRIECERDGKEERKSQKRRE